MSQPAERALPRRLVCGRLLLLGLAATTLGISLGPRPALDTTLRPVELPREPAALAAAIAAREAGVADLRSGSDARVVWADPARKARTPLALVYLHGYSACRQETRPVADRAAARLGANLFYARLAGHGLPGERLAEAQVNDWLNDAAEALEVGRRLGRRVVLVGASTGGTLALWLAARRPPDLAALILISPNLRLRHPLGAVPGLPWGRRIAELVVGPERSWTPINAQQRAHWTWRYPTRALVPLVGLLQLVARTDLTRITAPLLVISSPKDRVIDPTAIGERLGPLGPARLELTESEDRAYHVLAGDILAPRGTPILVEAIEAFVREKVR